MPFVIFHDNDEIGMVKIVLARDLVSAAQVESLKQDKTIRIGDLAKAQTQ